MKSTVVDLEERRVRALRNLDILDTPPEASFDRIVRLASSMLQTPIALVSLVDADRQWFKARHGLDASETPREHAFCAHAIVGHDTMVVPDATADPRFEANPLVLGEPFIRFYAGAPMTVDGQVLGTLCVIDRRPRSLTNEQRAILEDLAAVAEQTIRLRRDADRAARNAGLLALAADLADVGHWQIEVSSNEMIWSDETVRLLGIDPTAPPSVHAFLSSFDPESRDRLATMIDRALDDGGALEASLRADHGQAVFVRAGCQTGRAGQIVALFGVITRR